MARVTVEDCLKNCENRFALVHIAVRRTKELFKGAAAAILCKNKEVVTSLREIAANKISFYEETAEESVKKSSAKKK
ncbi:MAG: DNA-directed RNA polymerase subunit omega [bacterium]|nr:DNA-directed RNA polymerase subunit omega [bacterium]